MSPELLGHSPVRVLGLPRKVYFILMLPRLSLRALDSSFLTAPLCPPLSSCSSFLPFPRPHSAADSKLAGLPIKDKALMKSRGRGCTTALPSACLHKLGDTGRSTSQRGTDPTIQQDVPAPNTALSLCPDPLVGLVRAV